MAVCKRSRLEARGVYNLIHDCMRFLSLLCPLTVHEAESNVRDSIRVW
jgi:hypothetical protein